MSCNERQLHKLMRSAFLSNRLNIADDFLTAERMMLMLGRADGHTRRQTVCNEGVQYSVSA